MLVPRGREAMRYHPVDRHLDTSGWPHSQLMFARALHDAVERYVPEAYHGRILVYAARTQQLCHLRQVEAAWRSIADGAEIVRIAGTHRSLVLGPYITFVGNHLRDRLKKLDCEDIEAETSSEVDSDRAEPSSNSGQRSPASAPRSTGTTIALTGSALGWMRAWLDQR
jgi:hypothetical protein